jgi:hypothetical protein
MSYICVGRISFFGAVFNLIVKPDENHFFLSNVLKVTKYLNNRREFNLFHLNENPDEKEMGLRFDKSVEN